jgi:hypothetical protein
VCLCVVVAWWLQHMWFVEFYSPQCGHCQEFAPKLEALAQGLDGLVKVRFRRGGEGQRDQQGRRRISGGGAAQAQRETDQAVAEHGAGKAVMC